MDENIVKSEKLIKSITSPIDNTNMDETSISSTKNILKQNKMEEIDSTVLSDIVRDATKDLSTTPRRQHQQHGAMISTLRQISRRR